VFSIGFAITRSRALLRRLLTEHAPDDARQQLAERIIEHLEQSGFEVDEDDQALRTRPPASLHRTPGELGAVEVATSALALIPRLPEYSA
jgi:hypothetical protein